MEFSLLIFCKRLLLIYENQTSQFQRWKISKKIVFLFANIKSIQVWDDNDLKHVAIMMSLSKSKLLNRFLKIRFSVGKLKPPNKRKFSYEGLKTLMRVLFLLWKIFVKIHFVKVVYSFLLVTISCFRYYNSNAIISDPSLKSNEFVNLAVIPSFMHNIRPPLFLFLSFRNIL